jgi:hypothetical protein
MTAQDELIPAPPIVRERLARQIRQGRLLRAHLRISVRAAEERHRERSSEGLPKSTSQEGNR